MSWQRPKTIGREAAKPRTPYGGTLIEELSEVFTVKKITPYQYRINGVLDLFPTNDKYHHITKNERGTYGSQPEKLADTIKELLK